MDENQSVCHLCNQKFPAFELEVHFLECQTQDDNGNQQNEPKIVDLTEDLVPNQSPAITNQTHVHMHSMSNGKVFESSEQESCKKDQDDEVTIIEDTHPMQDNNGNESEPQNSNFSTNYLPDPN